MIEKGVPFDKSETGINCLFLNLMDVWDDAYLPLIEKANLPNEAAKKDKITYLKKIWYIDMEHEVFHAVSTWQEFIERPGYYVNRAIVNDFD